MRKREKKKEKKKEKNSTKTRKKTTKIKNNKNKKQKNNKKNIKDNTTEKGEEKRKKKEKKEVKKREKKKEDENQIVRKKEKEKEIKKVEEKEEKMEEKKEEMKEEKEKEKSEKERKEYTRELEIVKVEKVREDVEDKDKESGEKRKKFGYVAVVGRPNVGKSTLVNAIVGAKVAAVSPKPQTTRNRILGVKNLPDGQIVLVDTPGIHKPRNPMGEYMVEEAEEGIKECDIVYHIIDSSAGIQGEDLDIAERLKGKTIFAIFNKIDLIKKEILLPMIDELSKIGVYSEFIPISALKRIGIDDLLNTTLKYLPEGEPLFEFYYPLRLVVAEIIREKIFNNVHQEVPYQTGVEVEEIRDDGNLLYIKSNIYVERVNQRKILVGDGGSMIKKIGTLAREEIEFITGKKVYLDLWVKVKENWTKNRLFVKKLHIFD